MSERTAVSFTHEGDNAVGMRIFYGQNEPDKLLFDATTLYDTGHFNDYDPVAPEYDHRAELHRKNLEESLEAVVQFLRPKYQPLQWYGAG